MGTQGFVRRTRLAPPRMPGGEVNLQAPPEVPRVIPGNLFMKLMPFVMVVAVIGMLALMVTVGGRNLATNPMFMMFPMMMVMSMVGMFMGVAAVAVKLLPSSMRNVRTTFDISPTCEMILTPLARLNAQRWSGVTPIRVHS